MPDILPDNILQVAEQNIARGHSNDSTRDLLLLSIATSLEQLVACCLGIAGKMTPVDEVDFHGVPKTKQ